MGALSANGIFELVESTGTRRKIKSSRKQMVWRLKELEAAEYYKQELIKFVNIYLTIVYRPSLRIS